MRKLLTVYFGLAVLAFCGLADKNASLQASDVEPSKEASTYLQGGYVDALTAVSKLKAAGFEVLANYDSIENGKTIVFTCQKLKAEGSKPGRAYISAMRLFVDEQEKTISITNPVYFGKAFMQKDYNYDTFAAVKAKIEGAFPGLKNSPDMMDYDDLDGFHFTIGMPYYEDQEVVGEAPNAELLASAAGYKEGKSLVFELKLSERSSLLGYSLDINTKKFVEKIGRQNAGLLPWTISIEDGEAKMLKGEYYIAMHYPLLNMGGFMGIMSIPDAVIEDLSKPFKK